MENYKLAEGVLVKKLDELDITDINKILQQPLTNLPDYIKKGKEKVAAVRLIFSLTTCPSPDIIFIVKKFHRDFMRV